MEDERRRGGDREGRKGGEEEREGKEERKRGCEDRQRYETQQLASRSHTSVGREQRGGGRDIGRKE